MSIRARRAGRLARCAAAVAVAGVAAAGGAIPAAAATPTGDAPVVHPPDHAVFALRDPRIGESSGLAVASRERGVYFTHNDSGDSARFFAVDSTGRTLATFDVRGAPAVDWEDMATAPGPDGTSSVWLADIGDNGANHPSVTVYVVAEPRVTRGSAGTRTLPVTATYRLRYPDRPHDAETLLVDPVRRRAFIVTKSMTGRSDVYALPARPTRRSVATLRHVGSLAFGVTGSAGGPLGLLGALPATGGAPRLSLIHI